MSTDVDKIKAQLDVVDVLSEYINVKKTGANFKALCPFHNEKTPSFVISPEKQIWHCFGCGEGGDIFSFVEKIEGVEFPEALRILAQKAGVQISKVNPQLMNQKNRLMEIVEMASKFFIYNLHKSKNASKAREYIKERGLNAQTVLYFGIGYGPDDWSALFDFLVSRNFKPEEIEQTGLIIKKDISKGRGYYDRFRHRLIFPIKNINGEVIGFGGRILDKDQKGGKYINSPQSLIYNKSEVIYGLHEAKKTIKQEKFAIVVEGYLDVISNHQVDIKNVIASSGTAFTSQQVNLLKRYTNTLLFCFDADEAGQQALVRGIDVAMAEGMVIKVITIPPNCGKDPDECIKNNLDAWRKAINESKHIIKYFIDKKLNIASDFQQKTNAVNYIIDVISKINDKVEQSYWLKELSRITDLEVKILQEKLGEFSGKEKSKKVIMMSNKPDQQYDVEILKRLFSLFVYKPGLFKHFLTEYFHESIKNDFFLTLYNELYIYYNNNDSLLPLNKKGNFAYEEFLEKSLNIENKEKFKKAFDKLYIYAEDNFADFNEKELEFEVLSIIKLLQKQYIKSRINFLTGKLDKEKDLEKIKELSEEFNTLITYYRD